MNIAFSPMYVRILDQISLPSFSFLAFLGLHARNILISLPTQLDAQYGMGRCRAVQGRERRRLDDQKWKTGTVITPYYAVSLPHFVWSHGMHLTQWGISEGPERGPMHVLQRSRFPTHNDINFLYKHHGRGPRCKSGKGMTPRLCNLLVAY